MRDTFTSKDIGGGCGGKVRVKDRKFSSSCQQAILAVKGTTTKQTKSIGVVSMDLSDYISILDEDQQVEAHLERCPDKSATVKFNMRVRMIGNDVSDAMSSCF